MKILRFAHRAGARRRPVTATALFLAASLCVPSGQGQEQTSASSRPNASPAPAVDPDAFQAVLLRLAELEAEVKALRAQKETKAAPVQPSSSASDEASAPPSAPAMAQAAAIPDEKEWYPRMRIRGYADIGWSTTDVHGQTNSFALGDFNLFITSQLSERTSVVSELITEGLPQTNEFKVEVERVLLRYAANDRFNIAFGRYYTSIGYYNAAYPHSSWLQTAVDRPALFEFEDTGGILPVHNVGFAINGRIPSRSLGLHYLAELGNGRSFRIPGNSPVQNEVDDNNGKSFPSGRRGSGSRLRHTTRPESAQAEWASSRRSELSTAVAERGARGAPQSCPASKFATFSLFIPELGVGSRGQ